MSLTILLEPKSHVVLEQDSISVQPFELAQTLNFENDIDSLASYPFPEIELENEYDLNLNLVIQFYFLIQ